MDVAGCRLRFAFQVARTLSEHESPTVVQAWLTGVNPELGDRVPIRLIRESEIDAVAPAILCATRAYLSGKESREALKYNSQYVHYCYV
jgi:hypothetical protein